MNGSLAGHRAVVTGAGGALGLAVIESLVGAGAAVAALHRRLQRPLPAGVPGIAVQLGDEGAVGGAFADLAGQLGGPIDILVHAAGAYAGGSIAETALAAWQAQFEANLTSAFLCVRAVLPGMCGAGWGRIVTVGSRAGLHGDGAAVAYSAAKGALLRLTEAAAEQGLAHGVTVNAVLPGTIDTPNNRAAMPGADHDRWPGPAAIAAVCCFLCSDQAAIISGAAIPVYGRS